MGREVRTEKCIETQRRTQRGTERQLWTESQRDTCGDSEAYITAADREALLERPKQRGKHRQPWMEKRRQGGISRDTHRHGGVGRETVQLRPSFCNHTTS